MKMRATKEQWNQNATIFKFCQQQTFAFYSLAGIGYSNITMQLEGKQGSGSLNEWWNIEELLYDDNTGKGSVFQLRPTGSQISVPKASLITFNDKKAPESLSFLSGYG